MLVSHQPGACRRRCAAAAARLAAPRADARRRAAWLAAQGVAAPATVLAQAAGAPLPALAWPIRRGRTSARRGSQALAKPTALSAVGAGRAYRHRRRRTSGATRLALAIDWLVGMDRRPRARGGRRRAARNPDFAAALAAPRARRWRRSRCFAIIGHCLRQRALRRASAATASRRRGAAASVTGTLFR